VTALWNMAFVLRKLDRTAEAIAHLKEAIAFFHAGLTHSAHGLTVETYEELLQELQSQHGSKK
jgi:predicted RNase H-like HicB family nuclease